MRLSFPACWNELLGDLAPQVNELACIGAVRHRQGTAFSLGRSPCPDTWTLDIAAMQPLSAVLWSLSPAITWITTHSPSPEGWKAELV